MVEPSGLEQVDHERAELVDQGAEGGIVQSELGWGQASGDARNMGAVYVNEDLVVDGDLVTARTGRHCHLLAGADLVERGFGADVRVAADLDATDVVPVLRDGRFVAA